MVSIFRTTRVHTNTAVDCADLGHVSRTAGLGTSTRRPGVDFVAARDQSRRTRGAGVRNARVLAARVLAALAALALATPLGSVRAEPAPSDLETLLTWSADLPPRGTARDGENPLHDRVVFVSFVSAGCTIGCVVRTRDFDKAARAVPEALRTRVAFLAIGTDPAGDDAGRLRAFADGLVGRETPLRFRAGDAAGTAALAARLRYPAASLPEPPPTILAFDRRGRIAMTYAGDSVDGNRLLRDAALLDTFADGIGRPPRVAPYAAPF